MTAPENRFAYNYLAVLDKAAELTHGRKARVSGGLFFQNEVEFARQFKADNRTRNVVLRNWPDRSLPRSVDDWLFHNRPHAEGGLIVQTVNEIGFGDDNIQFHEALLERVKRDKIDMNLGILGLSVGTPGPDEWWKAEKLLRLAADMRDKVHIVLHEYFGGVVTSGFIGGAPDHAGVQIGNPGGINLIPHEAWPKDTSNLTMWHVGRYRNLKRFCQSKGIPLPRIIIGEFGADYVGDIGEWLKRIPSTNGPDDNVDGWRDLINQWRVWWPEWDGATALMKQGEYADKYVYIDPEVESVFWYARWNDGNWGTYQTNPELDSHMEAYSSQPVDSTPTVPTEPPEPDPEMIVPDKLRFPAVVRLSGFTSVLNLRSGPGTNYADIGDLRTNDVVTVYQDEEANKEVDDLKWIYCVTASGKGWFARIAGLSMELVAMQPEVTNDAPDDAIKQKYEDAVTAIDWLEENARDIRAKAEAAIQIASKF